MAKKREHDFAVTAFNVVQEATEEVEEASGVYVSQETGEKNPAAVALGKLGGKKGGKARAEKLSAEQHLR